MSFSELGLHPDLVTIVTAKGYQQPTPVQSNAIPVVLSGKDLMAGAQTGTGKTAAFALPILTKLMASAQPREKPVVLVLTPTRELAQQVGQSFVAYSQGLDLKTVQIYGGASINSQMSQLRKGADIIVATPGRLIDFVRRGEIDLSAIEFLVLDEADRMLDMGFIDEIRSIIRKTPSSRQTLFFSATFDDDIFALSKSILTNPERIEIGTRNATAAEVEQIAYEVDKHRKREITAYLIGANNWQQVLIFTRTKQAADELAKELCKDGIKTRAIHGDKSQGARDRTLAEFKNGEIRALVATDLASRGLDIQQLKYVINYELPHKAEDYVHRIGRTGRAGEKGHAITLLSADEAWLLAEIHNIIDTRLLQQWLPGFEPDLEANFAVKPKGNKKKRRTRGKR